MDAELKAQFDGLNTRLDGVNTRLEGLDTRLSAMGVKMDEMKVELKAHAETIETRLLSEFWKWARTSEIKARQQGGSISALDERLTVVEERISQLERRRAQQPDRLNACPTVLVNC
jgi:chromosome segregation ATPase